MIMIRLKITSYDKSANVCKAELLNGDIITLDPFAGCAIELSDEEYESGAGADIVGNTYILTEYTVYVYSVVPSMGGMIELEGKE